MNKNKKVPMVLNAVLVVLSLILVIINFTASMPMTAVVWVIIGALNALAFVLQYKKK